MRIVSQTTSAELTTLANLIDNITVAMMTTVDADRSLVSRPMTPLEMDAQGALWFFTDLRSSKVEQMNAVNVTFADNEHSTFVSLSGHGEVFANPAHTERLWTQFARPWFPDGPESPNLALLKFVPASADYWDAPSSKMVRMLALAASVVTGMPVALGEHGQLNGLAPDGQHTSAF